MTTLNVNGLTQNITPAVGVDGVEFVVTTLVDQNVSVNVDTGAFAISVQNAIGINSQLGTFANNLNGDVTVMSTGDITTTGSDGIDADLFGTGNIMVVSTGNITGPSSQGIDASHEGGSGNITVMSIGDITSGGEGINAFNRFDGTIIVTSVGTIHADGIGIDARTVTGDVTVRSTGNITTSSGREGIEATATNGNVVITSVGNITTPGDEGIEAAVIANGSIVITSTGDITALFDGTNDGDEGISALVSGTGSIAISSTGNITTDGDANSDGILGIVSTAGNLAIDSTGNITTTGADGIEASVQAGSTATVNLGTGNVSGGTGGAAGVNFSGVAGSTNILNTTGAVMLSSGSGIAINGGAGNTIVNNSGILTAVDNGAIQLGGGANAFNNMGGGIFNAGEVVNLGVGNFFNNSGTLSPGGSDSIRTTALTGNIVQNSGGVFLVNVDPSAGMVDQVTVTGTASLAGTVQVQVLNPASGMQSRTILTAAGGTTNNGLGLLASPALQASLSFPNANDVVLTYSIDFSAGGLNPDQTALAASLNTAVGAGSGDLEPILSPLLSNVFTIGDYQNALNQLLPEAVLNTETATLFSAEDFVGNLFSCNRAGDTYTALSEGECLWARPQGRFLDRDGDANTIGFDETSGGLAAGGQVAVAPNWFAGFALGYERASLDTDTGAETDSNRFSGGVSLKYQAGSFLLGAAISGGVSGNDTERPISFGGFSGTAESNYAVKTLTGQARGAYVFQLRDWFAKPLVDVTATYLSRDGVTETGAGAANLTIAGSDDTFFSVTPALEIGGDFALSQTSIIRPYVRAGVSFYTDSDQGLTANFLNAPAGTSVFSITSDFDDVYADVAAGATAFFDNGSTLALSYEGLISSDTQRHGFSLKGSIVF
ncbi:MAG: autotransporter domain-containing protein [Pseudomonadota bacterium]